MYNKKMLNLSILIIGSIVVYSLQSYFADYSVQIKYVTKVLMATISFMFVQKRIKDLSTNDKLFLAGTYLYLIAD